MTIKLGRTTVPPAPDVARDRRLAVWVLMAVAVGLGFLAIHEHRLSLASNQASIAGSPILPRATPKTSLSSPTFSSSPRR
jgi:hypothetical protein